ncbi:MAG TPA: YjbQ family protein, partial [Thermoanaerobacterales bacterium]|nr:YjbQ family protein [Thermoanaerobacterales bacterium]
MKSLTKYFWFKTKQRREYINITDKVKEVVKESGIKDGMVLVSA